MIICHDFVLESSVYRSDLIWARELRFTHFLPVLVLRLSRKCAHPAYNLCLQFISKPEQDGPRWILWPSRSARSETFAGPALAVTLHALHVPIRRPRAGRAAAPQPLSNGRATARCTLPLGKMLLCDANMLRSIKISVWFIEVQDGARYGKCGGANQNGNRVQRKNRMCKFKNQLGKMLSCNIYFHNSIPSSGQRAWATSSNMREARRSKSKEKTRQNEN